MIVTVFLGAGRGDCMFGTATVVYLCAPGKHMYTGVTQKLWQSVQEANFCLFGRVQNGYLVVVWFKLD